MIWQVWHGRPRQGLVGPDVSGLVFARQERQGWTSHGSVRSGVVWHGRHGVARPGVPRSGMAWQAWIVGARQVMVSQGRYDVASGVIACRGPDRQERLVMARKAWHDSAGRDGLGLKRLAPDWHDMAGTDWLGGAGIGMAGGAW